MKQFKTIFQFELKNYTKNKTFVGITLFLVIAIAAVMFLPRLAATFSTDEPDVSPDGDRPVMLVKSDRQENATLVRETFAASFPDYEVRSTDGAEDALREEILSGDAECAFVMTGATSYTYYVNNLSIYDSNTAIADEVLVTVYRLGAMMEGGLSADEAGSILSVTVDHEVQSLGKDQSENFFYTYIMIFALYMVILLYGQMVATNVATEKSSRAMEVLITSAKPVAMMFGKVFASCLAGFLQLAAVFGSAILFYQVNKSYWGENPIIASIFDMPADLFFYLLLFFVLGFLIYAFLYGAIGSTASKLEDINTSVMPLTFLFIFGFMVVMFSMTGGSVDNILIRICSYVPFTSPMAMFTRIAMSTVPWYEILLSVLLLIGSVIGVGVLSARIYRVGVLLYGTKPKLSAILKLAKKH